MRRRLGIIVAVVFVSVLSIAAITEGQTVKNEGSEKSDRMKIRLRVKEKTLTATLTDSKTTRDFVSLLPLTLTMNDLFHREKFAHLPKALSAEGKRVHTFEVGDIAYWSPGPDVAIYYRQDGDTIPEPGIIVMGKLDSGAETLEIGGSAEVSIELTK